MTREEALTRIEGIGNFFCSRCIKQKCNECNIRKAFKKIREDKVKLEAYENADLIERDSLTKEKLCGYCYGNDNPSLCTMDNCHKALETMIENIPRFEPTKGSNDND